jgi:hypothetical protein
MGKLPICKLFLLAVPAAGSLFAETQYMVDYLLPRGGQRGTTVTVKFHGRSLENPREILFYEPGIRASEFVSFQKPGEGFEVKFRISPDCAPGEHVLRVRTATSLSDAVTFWVGPFRQVAETETKSGENDSMAKAQTVAMNTTVEGQILPGPDMDRDYYRVQARKGQRISVEIEAARLGTLHFQGENDLTARILDADEKELAHSDDSALYVQDPVISVIAPQDGWYFVEIEQQILYPPRQAWYRAHIGDFSRPTAIFPAGGQAGTVVVAQVMGDPVGVRTERIQLPEEAGNFDYFTHGNGITPPPSANVLRVSPYPNVLKTLGEESTVAPSIPVALNGILEKPGEIDTYRFPAKKGQRLKFRVYARTLGAPVDAKIWLQSAGDARHLMEVDDSSLQNLGYPSSRGSWYIKDQQDPVTVFQIPSDGDYVLGIEDSEGQAGPDHVYRIEVEPARDAIYTHVTSPNGYQMQRLDGFIIPQCGRWTLDVQLAQGLGNQYKGEIELEAKGLPRGVTMIAQRYGKGVTRLPVQFNAAADAEQQSAIIELLARPAEKGVQLDTGSRQGFAFTNRPGELPWHFVFAEKYALAITQPAPFDIELEQPAIPLAQGGDLILKANIVRRPNFKGAVEIIPDWLPPGVGKGGAVVIPPDKTEGEFQIQANDKAGNGVYRIAMNASTTGGDGYSGVGRIRVSSKFVELKVIPPYVIIDLQHSSVEQGKQAQIVAALHVNQTFEGKATVRLQGLPAGVKMLEPAPEIGAGDKQAVFGIAAGKDALAGLYKGIACEISFHEAGQVVKQHTGSGILRVDEARAMEASR